jgi:hypothetical protein
MAPDDVQSSESPSTSSDTDIQGVVDGAYEQPRLTRRTTGIVATVLLAVALAIGASSAQASRPHKLSLRQVKTAIGRFASRVGIELESEAAKEEQRQRLVFTGASLHECEAKDGGGLCLVQWRFSDATCVGWIGALPAKPIKIVKLSAMKCAEPGNNESFNIGPSPNSNPGTDRHVGE